MLNIYLVVAISTISTNNPSAHDRQGEKSWGNPGTRFYLTYLLKTIRMFLIGLFKFAGERGMLR